MFIRTNSGVKACTLNMQQQGGWQKVVEDTMLLVPLSDVQ